MKTSLFAVLLLAVTFATGCSKPTKPVDESTALSRGGKIASYTAIATNFGLVQLAKKDKVNADKTAALVQKYINEGVLPFLNNQEGISTLVVHNALEVEFFDKVPEDIREVVRLAAAILDSYLPVPSTDTYLTEEYVIYLQSFFAGVAKGCDRYQQGDVPASVPKLQSGTRTAGWFMTPKPK